MSYIDRNLLAGEQVVFRTRLHWKLLVWPLLFYGATLPPHSLQPPQAQKWASIS